MTPDDVCNLLLSRSDRSWNMMLFQTGILSLFLLVVIPASVMFLRDRKARKEFLRMAKGILTVAEKHGLLTDVKYKEKAKLIAEEVRHILDVKHQVETATQDIREVKEDVKGVKDVVDSTAPLVRAMAAESPSGSLPSGVLAAVDPNNPPKRRADDK